MSIVSLHFRPRPIDINKPLPIIRGPINEAEATCIRGVPNMPTGMEPEEEEEAHIQEAIAASLTPSILPEIPTPVCRIVEDYDKEDVKPFLPPQTFIPYKDKTSDDLDSLVEYDLDSDDDRFLTALNTPKKLLTEEKFEFMIDRFEKEVEYHPGQEFTLQKAEHIAKGVRAQVISAVYEHWKKKRAARGGKTLMLRFRKPPAFDDPSPYVAFRPREKDRHKFQKIRRNDYTAWVKMKQLRQEMERARTLLEMIKKRERLKRDHLAVVADLYSHLLIDLSIKPDDADVKPPAPKRSKKSDSLPPPPPKPKQSTGIVPASATARSVKVRSDYYYNYVTVNPRFPVPVTSIAPPYLLAPTPAPSPSPQSTTSAVPTPSPSPSPSLSPIPTLPPPPPAAEYPIVSSEIVANESVDDASLEESDVSAPSSPDISRLVEELDDNGCFPQKVDECIFLDKKRPPFRGRGRIGRGGRILFDRSFTIYECRRPKHIPSSNNNPPNLSGHATGASEHADNGLASKNCSIGAAGSEPNTQHAVSQQDLTQDVSIATTPSPPPLDDDKNTQNFHTQRVNANFTFPNTKASSCPQQNHFLNNHVKMEGDIFEFPKSSCTDKGLPPITHTYARKQKKRKLEQPIAL